MLPSLPVTAGKAFGYMLEHPRIPRYQRVGREANELVTTRRVRTISRKDHDGGNAIAVSSETARRTSQTSNEMMIQSVLDGDVQRPAEMPGPR